MKYTLTILFAFLFKCIQAQDTYCGLTYTYDAAGNRIQRYINGDCSHVHEMLVVTDTVKTTPGITETLFPNPTTGLVSVVFNQPVTDAQITITDNLGRQLYTTTTSGSSIPLDMGGFAQGIYYIVVRTQGNKYQSSVVKK